MVLITGGAFQGKTAYAKTRYHLPEEAMADGGTCPLEAAFTAGCLYHYPLLVRRLLAENRDVAAFTKALCRENPDVVVVLDEIGCGIIPLAKEERVWREETGRAGCILAESAALVLRFTCGIPQVLKGTLAPETRDGQKR